MITNLLNKINMINQEFYTDEIVWLDKDLTNHTKVKVISQSQNRMYTKIMIDVSCFLDVMTYRLSRI